MTQESTQNKEKHLQDLLKGFDSAMLTTHIGEREHARPMAVAGVDGASVVWFVTADDSPKADEIRQDAFVTVTAQTGHKFVALSGRAELVKDRAKIDELWNAAWKVWFPDGKDDPRLALIRVTVADAEYWDNAGTKGIRYAYEAAKAYVKGETPKPVPGDHGRVMPSNGPTATR